MGEKQDYRISFFKPTTAFSKTNRNLVIVLVVIWAVAIFGFQIALRIMQQPTPEPPLLAFEKVWDNVESGDASDNEKIEFASSVLSVLGKSILLSAPEKRAVLSNAFSWVVYDLLPIEEQEQFKNKIFLFEKHKESITSLNDVAYVEAKREIREKISPLLNLKEYSIKGQMIPLELKSVEMEVFTQDNRDKLEGIMSLYLTHNQSVLTDTKFLGFPFHYFYTAVFLLILFVVLCWTYCFIIDRVHRKMGTYDKKA